MDDAAKIARFFELETEIWALVGEDEAHYPGLTDNTHVEFNLDERAFYWRDHGTYYGGDVRCLFKGEHYTIVIYDDGCGNRACATLLKNSNETQDEIYQYG